MTEQEISKGKELIAELMNFEYRGDPFNSYFFKGVDVGDLKFDSSWDWLMPVVNKIMGMSFYDKEPFNGTMIDAKDEIVHYFKNYLMYDSVNEVFEHIVNFVNTYNSQISTNGCQKDFSSTCHDLGGDEM